MKFSDLLAALVVGAFTVAPSVAMAQSSIPTQTMGRLEVLGRFAGDAPFCEDLGYTLIDRDGQTFSSEIGKLADRAGANPQEAEAAVTASKARQTSDIQAARDRVQANLKDPSGDRTLREFADGLSFRCRRAVDDPVGSVLMRSPPGAISTLSLRYVDSQLAPYGRAGWQSPYVLAGGDLAEAVGVCDARLSRAQGRAYLAEMRDPTRFSPDINDTIQAWLDTRIAKGREAAKTTPPSAAQCGQLLAKRKAALLKAPVD